VTVAPIDDAAADPDYGWFFQAVRNEFGWLAECGEQASAFTHFRGLAVQYALPAARVSIEYTPDPGDLRIELVDTSTVDAREELIWNVLAELEPETGWFPWPAQNQLDPSRATAVLSLWASGMRRHLRDRLCSGASGAGPGEDLVGG